MAEVANSSLHLRRTEYQVGKEVTVPASPSADINSPDKGKTSATGVFLKTAKIGAVASITPIAVGAVLAFPFAIYPLSLVSGGYIAAKKIGNYLENQKRIKQKLGELSGESKTDKKIGFDPELIDPELLEKINGADFQSNNNERDLFSCTIKHDKRFESFVKDPLGYLKEYFTFGSEYRDEKGSMRGSTFTGSRSIEAEYFLDQTDEEKRWPADKHHFTRGEDFNVGVMIENKAELGGKVLIRNMYKPPEKMNCTIRMPRVGSNGMALPLRDSDGNLIPGNFDTVVYRKGKPALVVQGSKGECRIANMKEMMDGLQSSASIGIAGKVESREREAIGMSGKVENSGSGGGASERLTEEEIRRRASGIVSIAGHIDSPEIKPSSTPSVRSASRQRSNSI